MEPAAWRKARKLTLRQVAEQLGISAPSVQNYETGKRDAPNRIVIAYERISKGEVTAEDLNRVRKRYLRAEDGDSAAA